MATTINKNAQHHLVEILQVEVYFDRVHRIIYSSDSSVFETEPLAVAFPQDIEDVVKLITFCHDEKIPLIARGAGTGLAGESVGKGIIVDLSKYQNSIIAIHPEENRVRVEAGVVLDTLNAHLRQFNKMIGPDPASSSRCTIGGMIANNSAGSHSLKYGMTREHITSLKMVLSNGEIVEVCPVSSGKARNIGEQETLQGHIYREIVPFLNNNQTLIEKHPPKHLNRYGGGYLLNGVVYDDTVDLTQLICGSEGTLGLVVEATLGLVDVPEKVGGVLFTFNTVFDAADVVKEILTFSPYAVELLDEHFIQAARNARDVYRENLPEGVGGVLLVEMEGSPSEVEENIRGVVQRVHSECGISTGYEIALDDKKRESLWNMRKSAAPLIEAGEGASRAIPFIEDTVVPPDRQKEYIQKQKEIITHYGFGFSTYGHAGAGLLHTRPRVDLSDREQLKHLAPMAMEIYKLCISLGGAISGEHGTGISRSYFLPELYGDLYKLFVQVKGIFDPLHILNPGKIVLEEDAQDFESIIKSAVEETKAFGGVPILGGDKQLLNELNRCTNCGECRGDTSLMRMCPLFRAMEEETFAPRAKINLIRALVQGKINLEDIDNNTLEEIVTQCLGCQSCAVDCVLNVNVARLIFQMRAKAMRERGQTYQHRLLVSLEKIGKLIRLVPGLAPVAARSHLVKTLLRHIFKVRLDAMPPIDREHFPIPQHIQPVEEPVAKVAYFTDIFARYFETSLAHAFLDLARHLNIEVIVPRQTESGILAMDYGDAERAKSIVERNAAVFSRLVDEGCIIVATEPSAVLALSRDALLFSESPGVKKVSENTTDAMSFFNALLNEGKIPLPHVPIDRSVVYHTPCHARVLSSNVKTIETLLAIPHIQINNIEEGCCGLGGSWGLKEQNYETSFDVGKRAIAAFRESNADYGTTDCSACAMQLSHTSGKIIVHPLKILAAGYGIADVLTMT